MGSAARHREAHERFNARDWDGLAAMLGDRFTYTDHPRGLTVKSRDEWVGWVKGWPEVLSDAAVTEPTYFEAGDTSIAVFTGTGTNDGPIGPFPPSNRRLSWPLCEIIEWDQAGKGVKGQLFYDMATMLVQAGHMEPPPAE